MPDEITLHTHPMSRGRIARWMLEEVGASYRVNVLDYGDAMKAPDYLAVNPMGKVPTLCHGDTVVTECAAICAYLADMYPDAGLAPSLDARGPYYRWLFFAAGPLESAATNKTMGYIPEGDAQKMSGYGTFERTQSTLEAALSGDGFILGENFSAADVYIGAHVGWGMQFGSIEKRPAFEAYWARVTDRDGYRKATELDDALMAEHPIDFPESGDSN